MHADIKTNRIAFHLASLKVVKQSKDVQVYIIPRLRLRIDNHANVGVPPPTAPHYMRAQVRQMPCAWPWTPPRARYLILQSFSCCRQSGGQSAWGDGGNVAQRERPPGLIQPARGKRARARARERERASERERARARERDRESDGEYESERARETWM